MICQLCKEEKQLLKNSHIIPNFLYRGLFDEKHKIINVNLYNLEDMVVHQTGFKDKDILCATCDNGILGKLERYASNTIFGNHQTIEIEFHQGNHEIVPFVRYKNLDYTQIKLFFLSILWKSHISKHPFFKEIDLGVKYSELLRQMIYQNDAGPEDAFEMLLMRPVVDGNRLIKSVIEPRKVNEKGNTYYVFHINELMYHFNISNYNKLPLFSAGIIRKDGILDIPVLDNEIGKGYFDSFLGRKIILTSKKEA